MDIGYTYLSKGDYAFSGILQDDLYHIIRIEMGYYFEEKYEESMDSYALAKTMTELSYFENESQVIRRVKTALKDKRITTLQDYIATKRISLKDGFSSPKEQNQLSVALDILDKCNKNILQLVYNISQEIKEGVLKKSNNDCYQLLDLYYSKKLSKKFGSFFEFIDSCYEYLDKTIKLVYGGRNYGKKH